MMTDSSPPSTEPRASLSSSPRLRDAALTGLAVALGVSGFFGAYAYLAPATYRSVATVTWTPPAGVEVSLDPFEAEQRLRAALLTADATLVAIHTIDGRTFELSCREGSASLAHAACNRLARETVERIPRLFGIEPASSEADIDAERQRSAEALVALLAAHPELTAETREQRPASEATDATLKALRGERAALEARLSSGLVTRSDNPYSDPASVDAEVPQLRRRLVQVSKEMDARREILARASGSRSRISPELRARWQELVKGAAAPNASARPVQAAKLPTAKLLAEASLPSSPLTPNRPLLLWIGLLLGTGGGALVVVLRSVQARRSRSVAPGERESAPSVGGSSEPPLTQTLELDVPRSTGPRAIRSALPARAQTSTEALLDLGTNSLPDLMSSEDVAAAAATPRAGASSVHDEDPFGFNEHAQPSRGPIVEIDAPEREPHSREISGIELIEHATKPPFLGRTTQALGSPIPAQPSGQEAHPAFHAPGYRAPSGIAGTQYSYVSVPPGPGHVERGHGARGDIHEIRPISTPPPPRPSSVPPNRAPVSAPRRISTPPQPPPHSHVSGSAPPRSIVNPRPVPIGWKPDASLVPEARRALSDELYPLAVGQCFVLGISGVRGAGEDTARVSAELALALAETGHPRILLLEGNLQRPSIHRLMRVEMPLFAGFSEQLEGRIQSGNERGSFTVVECSQTLHVIAEGVMRIPELILSRQFEDAVSELRNYYDVIVIDGPLISEAAACRAVHDVVDGVVLVCPKAGSQEIAEASALFSHKRFSTVLAAG